MEMRPGNPQAPMGATYDGAGTMFNVFSSVAKRVEVCVFAPGSPEQECVDLAQTGSIFHGYLLGVGPGWEYGFRVHGPNDPALGLRCNPSKFLLDPYAKEVTPPREQ